MLGTPWCWRRLLRVSWAARRYNQWILKETSPEYSLEGHAEAEAPVLWPPDAKSQFIREDPDWKRMRSEEERDGRRWDGWMASLTQWMWVWASSGRWWRTGKSGMLLSMGLQRVGHDWATEQQQRICWGFLGGSVVNNMPANAGDAGLIPGSGRSPGEGNGNPLRYSCLGNPMDRAAGGLQNMGSQKSQIWLND